MALIVSIAWRNIWRNPARSLVIIGSVLTGLWAGTFITAFFMGMTREQIHTSVREQLSHIQVHHPQFRELDESTATIPGAIALKEQADDNPEITATSMRILLTAMASSPFATAGVMATGIDPAEEDRLTELTKRITDGSYFNDSLPGQAILGEKLARKLQIGVNQKLVLTFQGSDGELTAGAFRVTGIFHAANTTLEENYLYVKRNELDALAGMQGQVHQLAIRLKDDARLENTASWIRSLSPSLKVETWKQLSPELRMMIDSFDQYMLIIFTIILLALVFGIINTMVMATLERYRELGVLMAIGLNKKKLFSMIVLETLLMTVIGCLIGLPLAWLTIRITGTEGINLSRFSEGLAMYGYGNIVYPQLETYYYCQVAAMATAATLLASIYPAYKAIQLKPAAAIRKI